MIYPLDICGEMEGGPWSVGKSTGLKQILWNPQQHGSLKGRRLHAVSCLESRTREKGKVLKHCRQSI